MKTHQMTNTKFWRIYQKLKQRCADKNNNRYYCYGARGIKNEWSGFEDFRDDMYESYLLHVEEHGEKNTSIDRIDSDGNYNKENCRWATNRQQVLNKRSGTRLLTYQGRTQHLCEWADEVGMRRETLWGRIKNGWTIERALTQTVR